jgi:antitoxin VapB
LFSKDRSQAVRLPAEFRFEGREVKVHRDSENSAVVLTPLRASARELPQLRNALLQEPGFRQELDGLVRGVARHPSCRTGGRPEMAAGNAR